MTTEASSSHVAARAVNQVHDATTTWSLRLLDWKPDDPVPDRVEILRRLTEKDLFLTREETDAALLLSVPASATVTPQVRAQFAERGRSIQFRERVKAFSREFFDLTRQERHDQLVSLKEMCGSEPGLTDWLQRLSAVVEIDRPRKTGDLAFDRLVRASVEIFVASPREASRLRQEFLVASREQQEFWGRAASTLFQNHRDFAVHIAPWTVELANWRQVESEYQQTIRALSSIRHPEATSSSPIQLADGSEWPGIDVGDEPQSVLSSARRRSNSPTGGTRNSFPAIVVVTVILSVLRLVASRPSPPDVPFESRWARSEPSTASGNHRLPELPLDQKTFEMLCRNPGARSTVFILQPEVKQAFYQRVAELNRQAPGTVTFDDQGNVKLKSEADNPESDSSLLNSSEFGNPRSGN